ncbi:MAG TPA: Fe-S cluster assembly protein HesB [Methanoregulaceae archaeon]|nr:Fe-S cluster assembly protein HesB [Methanoregulaceae archaeon]
MSGSSSARDRVQALVAVLGEHFGPLPWWRAPPEEVMIGAILVQQTRWENAERALEELRGAGLLSLEAIDRAPAEAIEEAVHCAGFFRVKTRRLKALARFVLGTFGSIEGMVNAPTDELRRGLLGVPGIGEETADAILCYAFDRCSFVIDAYTRRLCACARVEEPAEGYRGLFEAVLSRENAGYRQTHAHIVEYGKRYCSRRRCEECSIRSSDA